MFLLINTRNVLVKGNSKIIQRKFATKYSIKVVTASRRGAGTTANVGISIQANGDQKVSKKYPIPGPFERASVVERELEIKELDDSDDIAQILIGHDDIGDRAGTGWLLDYVEIKSKSSDKIWYFPLYEWIGQSDSGDVSGPLERAIKPTSAEVMKRKLDRRSRAYNPNARALSLLQRSASEKPVHVPWKISLRAFAIPHPDKVKAGERGVTKSNFGHAGEDSYFISYAPDMNHSLCCFGVADGVYSWRNMNIDAGMYSRALVQECSKAFLKLVEDKTKVFGPHVLSPEDRRMISTPEDIVHIAADNVYNSNVQGSSTLCVACFDGLQETLRIANIGDSGIILIRPRFLDPHAHNNSNTQQKTAIPFRTEEQEHQFGHPYQLGHFEKADYPEDAQIYKFRVKLNDVVVMGSDGLFDNVSDHEIQRIVLEELKKNDNHHSGKQSSTSVLERILKNLATTAFETSISTKLDTPYSRGASEAFDMIFRGGKKDDITILVGIIENNLV